MVKQRSGYVVGHLDWSSGKLRLMMIAKTFYGSIIPGRHTEDPRQAYEWQSRQAARQFLRRSDRISELYQVLNLRQLGWHGEEEA